jgi:CheY-like chemotaxis protein
MKKLVVLIAEDDTELTALLRVALEQEGFQVIISNEAIKALSLINLFQPDVVVTDIVMPDVSGIDLVRWIRQTPSYDQLPVIAISAHGDSYLQQAQEAGATAILHKPDELNQLGELVKRLTTQAQPQGAG